MLRNVPTKRRPAAGSDPASLAARLRGEPLPIGEALELARELTQAMKHVHDRGEAYGCLTPAAVLCADSGLTLAPVRKAGPSAYRAPELWSGGAPDARSDMFSLGAICYEMLSGSAPFRGKDDAALRRAVLDRAPELLLDAPPGLRRMIATCLEKRPERRLQRIGLLLTELRLHEIERRPAAAPGPSPPAPEARAKRLVPVPSKPPSKPPAIATGAAPVPAGSVRPQAPSTSPAPSTPGYLSLLFHSERRCPRCGSHDLLNSRPRNALERNVIRAHVELLRCQRCCSRFVRMGILRMEIDGAL